MKKYVSSPRDANYCHDEWTKTRKSKASTKAALYRTVKLAKSLGTYLPKQNKMTEESVPALPVRGGTWIIDSGSAFDIVSRGDLTQAELRRIEQMSSDAHEPLCFFFWQKLILNELRWG